MCVAKGLKFFGGGVVHTVGDLHTFVSHYLEGLMNKPRLNLGGRGSYLQKLHKKCGLKQGSNLFLRGEHYN